MAKKSSPNCGSPSKYGHTPRATFDAPSGRLNSKKSAATPCASGATGLLSPTKSILVELGALHKILDGLRPDDFESKSAWYSSESCCREIVLRFQNLLREWASDREKLDRCIITDSTLVKCQKCGVVRSLETPRLGRLEGEKKSGDRITARRQTDSITRPRIGVQRKLDKNFPIHQSCRPWDRNERESYRLPTEILPKKISTEEPDERAQRNFSRKVEPRRGPGTDAIDIRDSREKFSDIVGGPEKQLSLAETVEFLARAHFEDSPETKPHGFKEKAIFLETTPLFRVPTNTGKHIFDFHGSRDVDLRASDASNFGSSCVENSTHQQPMKITGEALTVNFNAGNKSISEKANVPDVPDLATRIAAAIHKFTGRSPASGENSNATLDGGRSRSVHVAPDLTATLITNEASARPTGSQNERESSEISGEATKVEWKRSSQSSLAPMNVSHFSAVACSPMVQASSISALAHTPSSGSLNCQIENSEQFQREILYDEISNSDAISRESRGSTVATSEILPICRKILESSETMDWESFKRLVTTLHPSQRELWCDICNAVSNEAKRVADETGATTEICIEINPRERGGNAGQVRLHGDEITFELDMILQGVPEIPETCDQPVLLQTSGEVERRKKRSAFVPA